MTGVQTCASSDLSKEEIIDQLGAPVFDVKAMDSSSGFDEFIYSNRSIVFSENEKASTITVFGDVLKFDIHEVMLKLGEPDDMGYDEDFQKNYLYYDAGSYGLFFYTSNDENDEQISEVELSLME